MFLISCDSSFRYFGATILKAQSPIETSFDLFFVAFLTFLQILWCVDVAGS